MELEHSFSVPVPVERAWDVLLDVQRVAPCMPGASLDSVEGDSITGKIKVKVGPIQMTYAGTAKFTERDRAAGVVTLEASGRETRGAGTASASVRSELKADGDQTHVVVHTTLNVTGKPAQFGRGVMAEVGGRLIGIFADNLAAMLAAEPAAATEVTAAEDDQSAAEATVPAGGTSDEALPIDVLNLSSRAWGSLRQDGIQTLGDLTRRTDQQLLALDNIGPASVADIRSKLADRGLRLADSADGAAPHAAASDAANAAPVATPPAAAPMAPGPRRASTLALAKISPRSRRFARPGTSHPSSRPSEASRQSRRTSRSRAPGSRLDNDAIDLLDVAGLPVLKRAVPAAVALLAVILVLLGIRRRRSRRS